MALFSCECKRNCTVLAVIAAAILGVLAAFLQITGVITVTPAFLWVTFGIAVGYLGALTVATVVAHRPVATACQCTALGGLLVGVLGTALLSVVLLAVGITATSVVSAILVGLLVGFFALILAAAACLVRCLADCEN